MMGGRAPLPGLHSYADEERPKLGVGGGEGEGRNLRKSKDLIGSFSARVACQGPRWGPPGSHRGVMKLPAVEMHDSLELKTDSQQAAVVSQC